VATSTRHFKISNSIKLTMIIKRIRKSKEKKSLHSVMSMNTANEMEPKLGADTRPVNADETAFGNRKYNRGARQRQSGLCKRVFCPVSSDDCDYFRSSDFILF